MPSKELERPYRFDTHVHTDYSLCSTMEPGRLVEEAVVKEIDEIVVKDHNEIDGAIEAREVAKEVFGDILKVRLGIELTTQFGEIGLSFLNDQEAEEIMKMRENGKFGFLAVAEKIMEMRQRGTDMMVDLHHPFDYTNPKRGFNFTGALNSGMFISTYGLMNFFDFTEVNTASINKSEVIGALEVAEDYNVPIVCSTDSHFPAQVGRYYTETDQEDARSAILANDLKHSVVPDDIDFKRSQRYRLRSWVTKRVRKVFG